MKTLTQEQIAALQAARSQKGRGYAPTPKECIEAAREGRLYDVDTGDDGEDSLVIADDTDDALAEVALAKGDDAYEHEEGAVAWATEHKWSAERVALLIEYESAAAFVERCVKRAPLGWSAAAAIEAARVLWDGCPIGTIICQRDGVYLCAEGYPRRDEKSGEEFWDDPASWIFWFSREEQRAELRAAA